MLTLWCADSVVCFQVREVVDQMMMAGLAPTARTLNILLKGSVATGDSLEGALEVFNSFCASGGRPGVISYNIL